jgi:hypothetical protein
MTGSFYQSMKNVLRRCVLYGVGHTTCDIRRLVVFRELAVLTTSAFCLQSFCQQNDYLSLEDC